MGKDSSELLWDDINRPKFYALLTAASASIRTCLYPAALLKTRLQSGQAAATSGTGAAATTPAAHAIPSATIHARPQAHAPVPIYKGTGDAFRTMLRTEGKFALYRGFRMNLLGLGADPIVIGCIEFTRTKLTYYSETFTPYNKDGDNSNVNFFFRYILSPETAITLISAGSSACVGQIIQVPVDVISQKKQMQTHPLQGPDGKFLKTPGTSSMSLAREIVNAEGVRGLYKGFGVTLCSAMPFQAILWAVYWPTQRFLAKTFNPPPVPPPSSASPPLSATLPPNSVGLPMERKVHPPVTLNEKNMPAHAHLPPSERRYLEAEQEHARLRAAHQPVPHPPTHVRHDPNMGGAWSTFCKSAPTPIAAFFASASASLATQPIDVIKTRLQVAGGKEATLVSTVRTLLKQRGYAGLMSGWYPRILAVSPGTTIMMSSYEVLKRYCQKE